MFTLTFSVYQAQTIWLMLIYNKMKAWFCEAYENIGERVSMLLGLRIKCNGMGDDIVPMDIEVG